MNKKIITLIVLTSLVLICGGRAKASIVYFNDFENGAGSEWSNTAIDITPAGGRSFLGQFAGDDSVSLILNNLPTHNSVTLSFDLFAIQSWDGTDSDFGPDIWQVGIDGGPMLLSTTFSNSGDDGHMQSYPGNYSDGTEFDAYSGASEINTLGYEYYGDSVYKFNFTFDHIGSSLKVNFAGIGLQDVDDESWGLDNVKVTVESFNIPEPASLSMFGFMGIAVFFRSRRAARDTKAAA